MSLQEFVSVLGKHRVLVLVATLLGALAAVGHATTAERVYQASAQSFVTTSSTEQSGTIYQGSQFTLQRVGSYTTVATSAQVLAPVREQLGLSGSVGALRARVQASNPADTVLVGITASAPSPEDAAALANAVAERFGRTVEDLERPGPEAPSPVKVTLIEPATAPSGPVSPRPALEVVLGLLVGAFAGTGLAVAREQLDTSVRTADDVRAVTGTSPLGQVGLDRSTGERLVALDPADPRSEPYRTIRTNLLFVDVDAPPRSLVITSALPGEGKSTTSCNLAVALAQSGLSVVLVEADLRRPSLGRHLQLEGGIGLTDVLAGRLDLDDALQLAAGGQVSVLAAGSIPPDPSELLGSRQMRALLASLGDRFDRVVLDAPPLLPVTDAAVLASACDGAVVVARHARTRRPQLAEALGVLAAARARVLGTVVTFVPPAALGDGYGYQSHAAAPERSARGRAARVLRAVRWAGHPDARAPRPAVARGEHY